MKEVTPLRARRFIVRFDDGFVLRKLFTLGFATSDGSIWAAFPYFRDSKGLLSVVTVPPGGIFPINVDLSAAGKVTSHLVKYSHHRSGEALFSQTGKVRPIIRKPSVPLNIAEGHLFTIQLQGLEGFDEDRKRRPDPPGDAEYSERTVTYQLRTGYPDAIKVVANCYTKKRLRDRVVGRRGGPFMTVVLPDGTQKQAALVAGLKGRPGSSTYVVLTLEFIPPMAPEGRHLTFIGGFDPPNVLRDLTKPFSFLGMMYPSENYEDLVKTIGSIDITRPVAP